MIIRGVEREVWSVRDLMAYLARTLDQDEGLKRVWLEAEISNFSRHHRSGHMYFTLKDEHAKVKAAMFAGNNRRLRFVPKEGDSVLVRGYLSVYDKEGQIQFYVQDMRLSGMGELYASFQQLRDRLADEGLFTKHKKPLPLFPSKVGVITSLEGAALRDILITMRARFPYTSVLILPVRVQGDRAAEEVAHAIDVMNELNEVDVLIVGRGGGSLEEIWAFNEEVVARSIDRSTIPVISAVGHETDTTISDLVADIRAATPTAAAQLALPSQEEIRERIQNLKSRMMQAWETQIVQLQNRLKRVADRPIFDRPEQRLSQYTERVQALQQALYHGLKDSQMRCVYSLGELRLRLHAFKPQKQLSLLQEKLDRQVKDGISHIHHQVEQRGSRLASLIQQLSALSPLHVLERGYSVVYHQEKGKEKKLVTSTRQVQVGDHLNIRLHDGKLKCCITAIEGE